MEDLSEELNIRDFWNRVSDVAKKKEISFKDLASFCGLIQTGISTKIYACKTPSVILAYKIARGLNVSIEYLLTGKDKINNLSGLTQKQCEAVEELASFYQVENSKALISDL